MIKQSNNIGQSTPLKQQESHKQNKEFLQYAKDFATQMQEEAKKEQSKQNQSKIKETK